MVPDVEMHHIKEPSDCFGAAGVVDVVVVAGGGCGREKGTVNLSFLLGF